MLCGIGRGWGGLFRTPVSAGGSLDHFSGAHSKAKHRNALDRPFNRAFNHNNNNQSNDQSNDQSNGSNQWRTKKNKAGLSRTPKTSQPTASGERSRPFSYACAQGLTLSWLSRLIFATPSSTYVLFGHQQLGPLLMFCCCEKFNVLLVVKGIVLVERTQQRIVVANKRQKDGPYQHACGSKTSVEIAHDSM